MRNTQSIIKERYTSERTEIAGGSKTKSAIVSDTVTADEMSPTANDFFVRIHNLTKTYGDAKAIDNINLGFKPGELTTLLGPSGCGKTTTLRCLAGFIDPTFGEIQIDGQSINHLAPYERPTGTVFQNYAIFPHMSVFDNVAYGLRVQRLSKAEIAREVKAGLELLGLANFAARSPDQLSGGQQQRVAIARVLVNRPKVLLLDEPLSNLDAKMRIHMRSEIRHLQQRLGITAIYVTHDQEEAMAISDRVVVLKDGQVEQVGTPMEVYRSPANPFVSSFIGTTNLLTGVVSEVHDDNWADVDIGDLKARGRSDEPLACGESVQLVLRPEMLELNPNGGDVSARIVTASFTGLIAEYEIRLDTGDSIIAFDYNPAELFASGDKVGVSITEPNVPIRKGWSHVTS